MNRNDCALSILGNTANEVYGPDNGTTAGDWPTIQGVLQPTYASFAQEEQAMMNGLVAYPDWPSDVQPDIDALVTELAADAGNMQSLADASTYDAWLAVPELPRGSAATVVRAKLGLESNVGTTTDSCEGLAADEG